MYLLAIDIQNFSWKALVIILIAIVFTLINSFRRSYKKNKYKEEKREQHDHGDTDITKEILYTWRADKSSHLN